MFCDILFTSMHPRNDGDERSKPISFTFYMRVDTRVAVEFDTLQH